MARIDKYEPLGGGFRAKLAADYTGSANPIGVGLNSSGLVVPGAGQTGVLGVICLPKDKKAGDPVDVMTDGELVGFGGAAGTVYYAHASTGVISTTASLYRVGATVEASRLVVRMAPPDTVAAANMVTGDQTGIADLVMTALAAPATPDGTIEAIPDPADTPASADALRDDLVANTLPAVRNAIEECGTHINTIIARLESAGVLTVV